MNKTCITFNAIVSFISELTSAFATNHPLKLYNHLLSKTTTAHTRSVEKHIALFFDFCVANRGCIATKNQTLVQPAIVYSVKVYIDFPTIFKLSDTDTNKVIWNHLLTISAIIDPKSSAKEILKKNSLAMKNTDKRQQAQSHADPGKMISAIMGSGIIGELLSGIDNGEGGDGNAGGLMSLMKTMFSAPDGGQCVSDHPPMGGGKDPMVLITTLMSGMVHPPQPQQHKTTTTIEEL